MAWQNEIYKGLRMCSAHLWKKEVLTRYINEKVAFPRTEISLFFILNFKRHFSLTHFFIFNFKLFYSFFPRNYLAFLLKKDQNNLKSLKVYFLNY